MKVLIAMDSFKGSLTSQEAGAAVSEGIKKVFPLALTDIMPVADGGEGTVDALCSGKAISREELLVSDPLGRKIPCSYIIKDKTTAIIEMSAASGLTLLERKERNPLYTTSYGTGEMIRDAVEKGCRSFIIGIGGSATNDGGAGMLQALGYSFRDSKGKEIPKGAIGLRDLDRIVTDRAMAELRECSFRIACDVKNPLCGERGCSKVFAQQKGADEEMIEDMELWLYSYSRRVCELFPHADADSEGAGAAGGLGFAFLSFLSARLIDGISLVLEENQGDERAAKSDILITGEGCYDGQTAMGKAPAGICRLGKKHKKPVLVIAGSVRQSEKETAPESADAVFSCLREITDIDTAMKKENALRNLSAAAEEIFRVIKIAGKYNIKG